MDNKVEKIIETFKQNNINGYFVKDKEEVINIVDGIITEGSEVAVGGSMTLFELGIIDYLRSGKYKFIDRYEKGLSKEQIKEVFRKSFSVNGYFASSNAITEAGEIYNVDGTGNRVAALLYGPDKVIIIAGTNKIVKDMDAARKRIGTDAAAKNGIRLNRQTPCTKICKCMDCKSKDRMCNEYTIIRRQADLSRMHVIFIDGDFGY